MHPIFTLVLATVLLPLSVARGQTSMPESREIASLVVSQPPTPRLINDRIELEIEVIPTWDRPVYINHAWAEFPEAVLKTRNGDRSGFFRTIEQGNKIELGKMYRLTFELPAKAVDWRWPFSQSALIYFKGGKHTITLNANVTTDVGAPLQRLQKTVEVEFLPAPGALILGGLAGSLLLVVFERLFRLSQKLNRPDWPRKGNGAVDWTRIRRAASAWMFSEGPSGIVQVLLGGFTVILFLILAGFGQERDLPISFKVDGFFSALGVGLFMHFVVVAIYRRLVPPSPPPNTEVQPPSTMKVEFIQSRTVLLQGTGGIEEPAAAALESGSSRG